MEDIPYALKSVFIAPCEQALTEQHDTLDSGGTLEVRLKPRGYKGDLAVIIQPSVTTTFQAEWKSKDITRFPSRIKAAATALRNCGDTGSFKISHDNGRLLITRKGEAAA